MMKSWILACFKKTLVITLFFGLLSAVLVEAASSSHQNGIRRFKNVTEWQATFYYELDFEDSVYDASAEFMGFRGLHGEDERRVVIKGTATYSPVGRGLFVGKGNAEYDVISYHMASMGNGKVIYTTDGKGTDKIEPIKEANFLQFNLSEGTYSFWVTPGHEDVEMAMFGVDVHSRDFMNLTDAVIAKMTEKGRPIMYPEMLRAMFPKIISRPDIEQINTYITHFPLPSFGYVLSGSFTDADGGVFSWVLTPSQPEKLKVDIESSIVTDHFHPPDEESRETYSSMRREAEDAVRQSKSFSEPRAISLATFKVYFVSETAEELENNGVFLTESEVTLTENTVMRDSVTGKFISKLTATSSVPMIVLSDEQLLRKAIHELRYPNPGFDMGNSLNVLSTIRLDIQDIELDGTTAIISGTPTLIDEISPLQRRQVTAQIEETALQFSFINKVEVHINHNSISRR